MGKLQNNYFKKFIYRE